MHRVSDLPVEVITGLGFTRLVLYLLQRGVPTETHLLEQFPTRKPAHRKYSSHSANKVPEYKQEEGALERRL